MKIVLTGGAGFIGSCYLWKLNSMGIDDVVVVDAHRDGAASLNLKKKKFSGYLTRDELLKQVEINGLGKVDVLVHLGACTDTTERDKKYLTANNYEFSRTLAGWCLKNGVAFHYASSASVYGDGKNGFSDDSSHLAGFKPLNYYAESKWQFDQWLINNKLDRQVVGFRYFNVFGPNEYHKGNMRSMVSKAYDQIRESGQVNLFATSRPGYADGSEERDFVYVKDAVEVMAYFLQNPQRKGIVNLGTGKARSFKDLMLAVFSALGTAPKIKYIPMPDNLKAQYQYHTEADLSVLRSLGYGQPFRSLEDSVRDYVQAHLRQSDPHL